MLEKVAILSDIHGNVTALEAVLADAEAQGATDYWLLGDILMPGPGVQDILDLLDKLPISVKVRGNWDDCFLESVDKMIDLDNPTDIYLARLSQYILSKLKNPEQAITQLRQLPIQTSKILGPLTFTISHHLPEKNYGRELMPDADTAAFDRLFEPIDADIAVYGHIHTQVLRTSSQGQLIINPGAVGQPFSWRETLHMDLRAQYAILEVDHKGLAKVDFRKVTYDIDREIQLAKTSQLPYLGLYEELRQTGMAHTHNWSLLSQINTEKGYTQDVISYFQLNQDTDSKP